MTPGEILRALLAELPETLEPIEISFAPEDDDRAGEARR